MQSIMASATITHLENLTDIAYNSSSVGDNNGTGDDAACSRDYRAFDLYLDGIAMGLLCVFGFVGNVISFIVLQKDRSTPVASFLLKALLVADNALLVLWFVQFSVKSMLKFAEHNPSVPGYPVWVYVKVCTFPLMYMAQTQTIWQTVVIALNRFMAVCMPYRAPYLCNLLNVYKGVFAVTLFSVAYNVPRFLELRIVHTENGSGVHKTALAASELYQTIYIDALYYLFSFVLPLAILVFVNTRVIIAYKAIQKRRKSMTSSARRTSENDNNITLVMITIVLIFIVCQAPARIVQIIWSYEYSCDPKRYYVIRISNTLEVLNSSVNFLVYCVFHNRFRETMRQQLGVSSCCLRGNKNGILVADSATTTTMQTPISDAKIPVEKSSQPQRQQQVNVSTTPAAAIVTKGGHSVVINGTADECDKLMSTPANADENIDDDNKLCTTTTTTTTAEQNDAINTMENGADISVINNANNNSMMH